MKKQTPVNYRLKVASLSVATLAVATVPFSAFAATTTTVNSTIGSTISMTGGGSVDLSATPTSSAVQTIASNTVSVSTNSTAGYTLKLAADSATLSDGASNTIAASAGTLAAPIAEAVNTWGFRVDNAQGFGAGPTADASNTAVGAIKFAGVPTTATTVKTTATTASNDTTTFNYGIAVDSTQPTGTYTGSVTYTATAN